MSFLCASTHLKRGLDLLEADRIAEANPVFRLIRREFRSIERSTTHWDVMRNESSVTDHYGFRTLEEAEKAYRWCIENHGKPTIIETVISEIKL